VEGAVEAVGWGVADASRTGVSSAPKVPAIVRLNWSRKFFIIDCNSCLLLENSQQGCDGLLRTVADWGWVVVFISESVSASVQAIGGVGICISLSSSAARYWRGDVVGSSHTVNRRTPRE
jgi:hypothetical protein